MSPHISIPWNERMKMMNQKIRAVVLLYSIVIVLSACGCDRNHQEKRQSEAAPNIPRAARESN